MFGYLIRRVIQMLVVILLSATASFVMLALAPGGPMTGFGQIPIEFTEEDKARIRSYYDLDLSLPVRFTRWLIGEPRGPIALAGREYFTDLVVGCYIPIETMVELEDGSSESRITGCKQTVTMADLSGRRVSRGVLFGDFGLSWSLLRDRPVMDLIVSRLSRTIELIALSTVLSLAFGIALGIYSAVKQYSRFDYAFTTVAFIGSAMPTFFFGILLILFFSIFLKGLGLPYLPPGSAEAARDYLVPLLGTVAAGSGLDKLLHLIMPVAVLTFVSVAGWSRFIRASMLDVLRQDYVRTARAKGLRETLIIVRHALRNALIPFITIIVFSLPGLFGGAIITETIFSWPGMGRLYFNALGSSDYPVAMAILLITAVLTVIATLLRDLLYVVVDPRIRLG